MGEVAWVRKYRPASFDDYMGDNVKNMVINRFANRDAIPNTIMLYGTRGTGKTSMARLLCKEILCMNPVDGHSCGTCEMCQAMDEYIRSNEAGATVDGVTEVDAATMTGKSDINDIIEDALVEPMYPLTHKIVIFDECHKLSDAAQNSLLKVVEEPPKYLIFIFCTTDPEKVISTIHSRIQLKLEVKKKSVEEMTQKLHWIAEQENLEISDQALRIIAKKGDRVPRECINILESIAKNFGNVVTLETVKQALGGTDTEVYIKYFKAANDSLESILAFNKYLKEKDISPKQFMTGLIRFTLDALYVRYGIANEDFSIEFTKQAKDLFSIYKNSSELDALLQIVEQASRNMDYSDDTKSELIITNTALRIGKVGILASGLATISDEAREENMSSIRKYQEILEEQRKSAIEKVPEAEIKKEEFASVFNHMTEVKDGIEMLDKNISAQGVQSQEDSVASKTQRLLNLLNSSDD